MTRCLLLVVLVLSALGCAEPPRPAPVPYAPYDSPVDCEALPELCGLPLYDLGGGDHEHAYHLVFVGDGFLKEDLPRFEARVQQYVRELSVHGDGFVTWAPELFHFWRVDLPSETASVDDDVRTDTPLAAHLSFDASCASGEFLEVHDGRAELVARTARLVVEGEPGDEALATRELALVSVVRGSLGRANGGDFRVRISDLDSTDVLRHELGHALFGLGDEYTEFQQCPWQLPDDHVLRGPSPDVSEERLLAVPNLTRVEDPAKWLGAAPAVEDGGGRWPCLNHPTQSCLMLGEGSAFCPVCEAAVRERLQQRRCGPDELAPRVALVDEVALLAGGSRLALAASAFDERGAPALSWTLGDAPLDDTGPFAVVPVDELKGGAALRARARDEAGNEGRSAPLTRAAPFLPEILSVDAVPGCPGELTLFVDAGPAGGRLEVELRVGDEVRHRSTATIPASLWTRASTPAPPPGADAAIVVTAVSADGLGRSAPFVVELPTLEETPPPPEIRALVAGSVALPMDGLLIALPATAPLAVSVSRAAAPPVEVGVFAGERRVAVRRDPPLGEPRSCSQHSDTVIWLEADLLDVAGPDEKVGLTAYAIDALGRRSEVTFVARIAEPPVGCGFEAVVDAPSERVYGRYEPISIRPEGTALLILPLLAWHSDSLAPAPLSLATRERIAFSAVDVPPPRAPGAPEAVGVFGLLLCDSALFLARSDVEIRRDLSPPVLLSPTVRAAEEPLVVFASDDRAVVRVEAVLPSGEVLVDDAAPYTFDVTGPVTLRAYDEAGNVGVRESEVALLPARRSFSGCEEAP